jgi:enamine deaminase RidA (YjgF/YER057c/UK114 family)
MEYDDETNGVGILSGPPPDPEVVKRAEAAETKRLELEAAAAQRAAEIEATCDEIDAFMTPYLKAELELENSKARVNAATKKVFERFKACCASWGLPALPAPPQAVAVFLTDKNSKLADIEKLAKQISLVHRAVGYQDPCQDILIRALLRQAREGRKNSKKGS